MSPIRKIVLSLFFSAISASAFGSATIDAQPTMREVQASINVEDYAAAAASARAIAEAQPNNANAWFFLGYALHAGGRLEEAIVAHRKAASFPQTAPLATYNLACALALQGSADEAFESLDEAAGLGVRDVGQYTADPELSSLHDDERWGSFLARVQDLNDHPPEEWLLFWEGSWDCYSKNGYQSGTNTFTQRLGGKVLHEQWVPSTGAPGESWNYYDPGARVWRQTWVESDGAVTHFSGTFRDGGVFFEGERSGSDGSSSRTTMFVRPIGDEGWVRQTGAVLQPDGSFVQSYDLVYVPRGVPFDASKVAW